MAITTDLWTNASMEHFITVTGAFINDAWQLQKVNLATVLVSDVHCDHLVIKRSLDTIWKSYNFSFLKKYFTTDSGSNVKAALAG